ncbi:uncharacterized protein LOC110861112 isoform X1 [Folsomia candida]|uniref:uncharacterized protein LOC110861112 isoform X1 n=1 Tax=Folsomia candida TaxID=158441 RepID=UPI000B8F5E6C|nr:uncharacterized protein LOC110861112 isoform X1 [Folsomia candida]XP_035716809.1 uncharacterized protein LOC110861112 isoform X1 [Folsomia candida]
MIPQKRMAQLSVFFSLFLTFCTTVSAINPTSYPEINNFQETQLFCIQESASGGFLHYNGYSDQDHLFGLSVSQTDSCFEDDRFLFRNVLDNDGFVWIQNVNLALPLQKFGAFMVDKWQEFIVIGRFAATGEIRVYVFRHETGLILSSGNDHAIGGGGTGPFRVLNTTIVLDLAARWEFLYEGGTTFSDSTTTTPPATSPTNSVTPTTTAATTPSSAEGNFKSIFSLVISLIILNLAFVHIRTEEFIE